ncbi:MAG TPA: response regulator transcription factor [Cellvibrio sp.]|nr:response regulator transcription factor [Cellvibrio sp.]
MSNNAIDFLIVDDDATLASMLERVLQRRGFTTASANDAAQALQLAGSHTFTRAIVDLKLGNDSGLHLIRELKLQQPQIAIVMLTGYSSISTAVEAVKLGAVNYLCKPADADEIIAAFGEQSLNHLAEPKYTPISIDRLEWEHIQKILQENSGNISATARVLGMHRRTLQRKLQKRPVKQ